MEASQAGLAGGDGAAQGEGQQQQGEQAAPDFGQMPEQLQTMAQSLEQVHDYLRSEPWSQQQEGGEGDEQPQYDLSQLGPEFQDMEPEAEQQFQQGFEALVQQAAERIVDQRLGPIQQQVNEEKLVREASWLTEEFPALKEPSTAQEVVAVAQEYAHAHFPPDVAEKLANSPAFWRWAYLAHSGVQAANEEGASDGAQAATLEGGGGAAPAGATREGPYFRNDGESGVKLPF